MRKFTSEELTQEEVVSLLKAALMAPTSKRSNSWQFIAVDDKACLERLSHCKKAGADFLKDAALAVVVLADPLASDVWIEDASIASIYIQLQAEDLGLGSCWIQVRERFTSDDVPARICTRSTGHPSTATGTLHHCHRPQRHGTEAVRRKAPAVGKDTYQ